MAIPVKLSRLSKFAETSEVLEWYKSPGDLVEQGEVLLTVLSDKASVEIPAPVGGVLLKTAAPAGVEVPAGSTLGWIGQPGESLDGVESPVESHASAGEVAPEKARLAGAAEPARARAEAEPADASRPASAIKAAPAARRLAAKHGVLLETLVGSGPRGLITASDVEQAVAQSRAQRPAPSAGASAEPSEARRTTRPLRGVQRSMAQLMQVSHATIVQATTVVDVDMTEIVRLRERVSASFVAFVIKAAAASVAEFPLINASLQKTTLVLNEHVDVGVAVTTEEGLLVPVIRSAESKSLMQIHHELQELSERARRRALTVEELSSPTMSVTNSGTFGSLLFTPIVVVPQSVTLGMGKIAETAVVRDGQIVVREIMYLCLSYDHRLLEGSVAVRYLQRIKAYLEEPLSLLGDEAAQGEVG